MKIKVLKNKNVVYKLYTNLIHGKCNDIKFSYHYHNRVRLFIDKKMFL